MVEAYARLSLHRWMLRDDVRNEAYRAAINKVVKPGDTVIDMGAGSGILSLFAAQAGILLANSQSLREARRLSRQLTGALASRDAVAQAIGVLLARGAAGQQEAFASLAATARQSRRPVEDVARALVATVTAGDTGAGGA